MLTGKRELNLGFRIGKLFNEIKSTGKVLSVSHHYLLMQWLLV